LELRSQAELQPASRDDFQHLMLGMIAKLSPCSEQRLLDLVAGQAGEKSLRSQNKSIRRSLRELQTRGFVGINGDQIVVTDAGKHLLQIKSFLEPMHGTRGLCGPEDLKAARQHAEPWEDAASEFEKAVEALKTAEPDTPVKASSEFSSELTLPGAIGDLAPVAHEEEPLELSPSLALPPVGADQASLLKFEEQQLSSITELSPVPLSQDYAWGERRAEVSYGPRFAWLIENIPRRMRACVPLETEIGVSSTIAPEAAADPVGQGKTRLYGPDVAQAMSLRLSAPRRGFTIEAQSPETQWIWSSTSQSMNELAAWRFIITPRRRGSYSLRLTFSYKEIGPNGLLADSALPDRMLDIVVSTNLPKTLTQAAIWVTTLIVGVALGAYFKPAMQFINGLYR
jgi:hypothetical protein